MTGSLDWILRTCVCVLHLVTPTNVRQIFNLIVVIRTMFARFTCRDNGEKWGKKLIRNHEFLTTVAVFRHSRVCAGASLTSVETPMWARHQKQPISPRDGTESRLQTRLLQQTPMTVYYRQFQTSYARGLNIANGDNRQVPQLPWWKVCVCQKLDV